MNEPEKPQITPEIAAMLFDKAIFPTDESGLKSSGLCQVILESAFGFQEEFKCTSQMFFDKSTGYPIYEFRLAIYKEDSGLAKDIIAFFENIFSYLQTVRIRSVSIDLIGFEELFTEVN